MSESRKASSIAGHPSVSVTTGNLFTVPRKEYPTGSSRRENSERTSLLYTPMEKRSPEIFNSLLGYSFSFFFEGGEKYLQAKKCLVERWLYALTLLT